MALNLKEQASHGRFQVLELALISPFYSTSYDLNFNLGILFIFSFSICIRVPIAVVLLPLLHLLSTFLSLNISILQ